MKKRLNLLNRKKRFDAFASYALKIKRFGTVAGIALFFVFLYVVINTITLKNEISQLAKKKELYLSVLFNEKDVEANIRYFKGKQTQLLNYEKDDAHFVPYYQVLLNVLSSSASQSARLDTIEIDKNRDTSFVVKCNEYNGMVAFLKYVESDEFLSNFETLSMASLNLSRESPDAIRGANQQKVNKNYQLQFKGRFKELIDEAN